MSVLPYDISKTVATRITKVDKKMFHDESWKPIYFGVKRSKVKTTSHRNIADVGLCTLVSVGFFSFIHFICSTKIKTEALQIENEQDSKANIYALTNIYAVF